VLTKLFNVCRFASQFDIPADLDSAPSDLDDADRWILAEFCQVNETVNDAWRRIDIYTAAQSIKNFGTGIFPSHWLEMAKHRLYDDDENAAWTLHRIVRDLLDMFTPICPFFTHHLSSTLYGTSSVDARRFPEPPLDSLASGTQEGDDLRSLTGALVEFNSDTWRAKKDAGISLNAPISDVSVPDSLAALTSSLAAMHKLEQL